MAKAGRGRSASGDAPREGEAADGETSDNGQLGIQSIEIGMQLMSTLVDHAFDNPPPMLKTLAAKAGMPPAKAHRYMVSLVRAELVERDAATGRYRLGPMARHIGLRAIQSLDVVRLTTPRMPAICADIGFSVALAIWAYGGPTIIAIEERRRPITIGTRIGELMPIVSSATGQIFGTYLPRATTEKLIKAEIIMLRKTSDAVINEASLSALFDQVRGTGLGSTEGGLNPTVNALSAPIFDFRGTLVGALSTLGPANELDPARGGELAQKLKAIADGLSRELGYDPDVVRQIQ